MDTDLVDFMYVENIIDEDKYIIMSLPSYQKRLLPRVCLDLASVMKSRSKNNFRFRLEDLPRLAAASRFLNVLHLENEGK